MIVNYDGLFCDEYRAVVLCEYKSELALIRRMIEAVEESVKLQKPGNEWDYEGICYMFAKSIVDYVKMAYDNMQLGHFNVTHMIFRTALENCVCLDIIKHHPED